MVAWHYNRYLHGMVMEKDAPCNLASRVKGQATKSAHFATSEYANLCTVQIQFHCTQTTLP